MKIKKAIIAAAGQGTRFLPQTKAIPKEMLPIIDKPIIQYIVEELVEAGIEDIVIVTSYHKRSIEDHFDEPNSDLVETLSQGDEAKKQLLKELYDIANLANFIYVRQKDLKGNAVPLLNSESIIGNEPFIYTFADDFIKAKPGRFSQLVNVYDQYGLSVLSCLQADDEANYKQYGYVGGKNFGESLIEINTIIEKPGSKAAAPSSLASLSSYAFNPSIFRSIHKIKNDLKPGEELLLQKAIQLSIDNGEKILAYEIKNAKYYDNGNKLEYLKTIVDLGLQHPTIGKSFNEYIRSRMKL
jgi:UTP--glucose-1-phosphate uridylyltransferase